MTKPGTKPAHPPHRSPRRARRTRVTPSSGNVFTDLGVSPEEAANLKIRSVLMGALQEVIAAQPTQTAAARLLKVTQPRVSDLVRGKIELFSIDTLVDLLV